MPDDDYKFRYISAYRLAKSDLQDYLDRKFSPNESTEYFIEVCGSGVPKIWRAGAQVWLTLKS